SFQLVMAGSGDLAEWVLVELQGELESRCGSGLAGKLLGDLHFTKEGPTDALDAAEVGLACPLHVERHPVAHTA
uniref:Uncharacterized protein n=1 Tax=Salvator merianae TaxID=96440 RepID=A0A8D0BIB5_SALMN